jgi:hypothetical protein
MAGRRHPGQLRWRHRRRDRALISPKPARCAPPVNLDPHHPTRSEPDHGAIIAFALIAVVALAVLSAAVHVLFSPWLLVAVAIVAWIKFRPRRSQQ